MMRWIWFGLIFLLVVVAGCATNNPPPELIPELEVRVVQTKP